MIKARDIPKPQRYITALLNDFKGFALDEDTAESMRGRWRQEAFQAPDHQPLDVEIGTGNGHFFAHRASTELNRLLVGIELKFKPLILSAKRAMNLGIKNARITRNNAAFIEDLFAPNEINNIFVHHPDPWNKRKKHKRRLLNSQFLERLWVLQRPGGYIDFKTDSPEYFFWAMDEFKKTSYRIEKYTEDLHKSEYVNDNFITQFERIFISKNMPIYYLRAVKPAP